MRHVHSSPFPLVLSIAAISSFTAGAFSPSPQARRVTALLDAHGPITAAPSFEEYMKQRAAGTTLQTEDESSDGPAVNVNDANNPSRRHVYRHNIGRLLLQRSIQTQLYYLADLRDEPTYKWLRGFLDQNHLDDRGSFNELDGLHAEGGWRGYLSQLEQAPTETITVQLAPPRLSAQQKRNPYLAAQVSGRSYEETIDPAQISRTLRTVARSLEREWAEDLAELAAGDRDRATVHYEGEGVPYLQTAQDAAREYWLKRQVVAGGEGDDQGTPLHDLNRRLVARFCTRAAFRRVVDEIVNTDNTEMEMEMFERSASAGRWLLGFSNAWVPRLEKGADDAARRSMGTPPPGQWQRLCAGADADDATEALWQELPQRFTDDNAEAMRLYSPEALVARVRKARLEICNEAAEELRELVNNEFCA